MDRKEFSETLREISGKDKIIVSDSEGYYKKMGSKYR
jgi:hypothetical protein